MQSRIPEQKLSCNGTDLQSQAEAFRRGIVKERRNARDRREQTLWAHINLNLKHRRRCHHRRASDPQAAYLDCYNPALVGITLCVLLLSCLDATFTLTLLQRGSIELNPLMAWLINVNHHLFVAVKLFFTGIGLILLLAHTHFRVFRTLRVVYLLYLSMILYFSLTAYELVLLNQSIA